MENGTIKFFDSRNNKRYGFITVDGGGEIFFHYNDGARFRLTQDDKNPVSFTGGRSNNEPRKGDRVKFNVSAGSKGRPKASPWGFANEYKRAYSRRANTHRSEETKAACAKTVPPATTKAADPVYRVLRHELDKDFRIKHTVPYVFWEGTLAELCKKFPQARDPNKDPLFIANKGFMVGFQYEVPTPTGWEICNDPRPVVKE